MKTEEADLLLIIRYLYRNIIIGSYAPYFVVPLWMAVDASLRLWHMVGSSEAKTKLSKIE